MEDPLIQKIDEQTMWSQIREEYMRGGISCKQLSKKYPPTAAAISTRCRRERWRKFRPDIIVARVEKRMETQLMTKSQAWIAQTVDRMAKYRIKIDDSAEQMHPAIDPLALTQLAKTEQIVDDLARRSLGIKDEKSQLTVNVAVSQQVLASFDCVKKLHQGGELTTVEIDLEELRTAELEED